MRYTEVVSDISKPRVFESPQTVQPTDFALSDPTQNRRLLATLMKRTVETFEDTPKYSLRRAGDISNGNIYLVDKQSNEIDYLVHYKKRRFDFLGITVSQLKLWRRLLSPHVSGLTKRVFFDILLARYPAILSDGQQTADGRGFWLNRMAEATNYGLRVGFVNLNTKTVIWYDPRVETVKEWLGRNEHWGSDHAYRAMRYIIACSH